MVVDVNSTPAKVIETKGFLRVTKSIRKKDPKFVKRAIAEIQVNHHNAVHLGQDVYKIRVAKPNEGKSGGYRVFYYVRIDQIAFLLAAIDKREAENLSQRDIEEFFKFIDELNKTTEESS